MRNFLIHCISAFLIVFVSFQHAENSDQLDSILLKTSEYCQKLNESALNFVCEEHIDEDKYTPVIETLEDLYLWRHPKHLRKRFVYDYQLIRNSNKIEESRTLIEENGKKRNVSNADVKIHRFYSVKSIFGPVGLLGSEWFELYKYKLLKEEKVGTRSAYVIEAIPKKEIAEKPNYGKLWVDKEDFTVLIFEVRPESLAGFKEMKELATSRGLKLNLKAIHEYGVLKDGLRFPSKTKIEEGFIRQGLGERYIQTRTTIHYRNYRFFSTETDSDY